MATEFEESTDFESKEIVNMLNDFNFAQVEPDNHQPLKISAKVDGRLVGGLVGGTYWSWLYIDVLVVHPDFQGQGIGKTLLEKAETKAVQRLCIAAHLNSHDFQAVDFYQKYGYKIIGTLEKLPRNHKKHILFKLLE